MINEICVFGLKMRTTSSLESCNSALARRFPKNGNFFRFVSLLIFEEKAISNDFTRVVDEDFQPPTKKRKETINRESAINTASQLLIDGEINVEQFLAKVARENKFAKSQLEFEEEDEDDVEYEDEVDDLLIDFSEENSNTNDSQEQPNDSSGSGIKLCFECKSNQVEIVFIPCGHVLVCKSCYDSNKYNECLNDKCKSKIQNIVCMKY